MVADEAALDEGGNTTGFGQYSIVMLLAAAVIGIDPTSQPFLHALGEFPALGADVECLNALDGPVGMGVEVNADENGTGVAVGNLCTVIK